MKFVQLIFTFILCFLLYFGRFPLGTFSCFYILILQGQNKKWALFLLFLLGLVFNLLEIHLPFGSYPLSLLILGFVILLIQSKIHKSVFNQSLQVVVFSCGLQFLLSLFAKPLGTSFELFFLFCMNVTIDFLLGFVLFWIFDILEQKVSNVT